MFGIRGWLKVFSETEPRTNIVEYDPWLLWRQGRWETRRVESGHAHGTGVLVKLAGCDDRDAAAELVGTQIAVRRNQLADDLAPGQYYWTDLEGLAVVTRDGAELGRVDHLFETGANDVMFVVGERERLIPYIAEQVVKDVDLEAGVITVDWDPDF